MLHRIWKIIRRLPRLILWFALLTLLLPRSAPLLQDPSDRIRTYTRDIEFDFVAWTLDALWLKIQQLSLSTASYLPSPERRELVSEYIQLVTEIQQKEAQVRQIFSDPAVTNPTQASATLRAELDEHYARRAQIGPVAEAVLEEQMSAMLAEMGFTLGGQPIPPVLYHSTPLPMALVVSPRDAIRQEHQISLDPELPVDEQVALEEHVDRELNVSSLVVPVGGIGMYPTMVLQTSNLPFLTEVIAHEWIHNYLTLRPLGVSYLNTPELRIMNETAAAIAGKEIGQLFLETYYPELARRPVEEQPAGDDPPPARDPLAFDFNREMHHTRLVVDDMLAAGQVEAAEKYMEARRKYIWENGYHIRKLNQAYFAFYGAYADETVGAAGEDPVGAAVRSLRDQSPSLVEFVNQISWMTSFSDLQQAVAQAPP